MEIIIAKDQGYCQGVKRALKMVNEIINDNNIKKPIYILGAIIHNERVIAALKNKGVIILEGKSRFDMLDEIDSGTVIFSAHGVCDSVYQKAKEKGLNIIDATCPVVLANKKRILTHIEKGYQILFVGKKNHPETEGMTYDNNDITIISENDFPNIDKNKNYYCINQTTLSILDMENLQNNLSKYPNVKIENSICMATTNHQKSVLNLSCDLAIVVGSKTSSNSTRLKSIIENQGIKTLLINSIDELKDYDFTHINKVFITSSASTPKMITEEIIDYLKNYEKNKSIPKSKISDNDLLSIL